MELFHGRGLCVCGGGEGGGGGGEKEEEGEEGGGGRRRRRGIAIFKECSIFVQGFYRGGVFTFSFKVRGILCRCVCVCVPIITSPFTSDRSWLSP